MGSLAEHGMNVVVIAVILRSLSLSIVRDAIIPGTPHPVPMRMGMNDFPDRPNLLKTRSITKAILAMYPLSSNITRRTNSTSIWGRKPRTAPTPAMSPSTMNAVSTGSTAMLSSHAAAPGIVHSPKKTSFTQSVPHPPTVVMEI